MLPEDISYSGKVVRIYNENFGPYTRTAESFASTTVFAENSQIVGIPPIYATDVYDAGGWDSITIMGGYVEFVGLPTLRLNANNVLEEYTRWICIKYNGVSVTATHNQSNYLLSQSFADSES